MWQLSIVIANCPLSERGHGYVTSLNLGKLAIVYLINSANKIHSYNGRLIGTLPWQTILGKFAKWPLFNTLAFRNGFEYRTSDLEVIKDTIFATFYAILVKIDPLTPKIMWEVPVPFGTRRQNRHIISNISASTQLNFTNLSALVGACMQIIKR